MFSLLAEIRVRAIHTGSMTTRRWGSPARRRADAEPGLGQLIRLPVTGREVLFVCDISACAAMAASFFELKAGALGRSRVLSPSGPQPLTRGDQAVMTELGIDLVGKEVEPLSDEVARTAAHIVVLGASTVYHPPPGTRAAVERWPLDEPAKRGIVGVARLRLIRDGIEANVNTLVAALGLDASSS